MAGGRKLHRLLAKATQKPQAAFSPWMSAAPHTAVQQDSPCLHSAVAPEHPEGHIPPQSKAAQEGQGHARDSLDLSPMKPSSPPRKGPGHREKKEAF